MLVTLRLFRTVQIVIFVKTQYQLLDVTLGSGE